MNNETVLKLINKRIDEVHDRIDDLTTSYKVLNESHGTLENGFIEMKTEWNGVKTLGKYIFGTSLLAFLVGVLNVLKLWGVI